MLIRYKELIHERFEDAPFVGALLSAIDCHIGCSECFNQYLKDKETKYQFSKIIIKEIKRNPFNKGIIFGGLEWSEQPQELREMVKLALDNDLQVIIYSGLSKDIFKVKFPDLCKLPILIKTGPYQKDLATDNNIQYGIKLATENQNIWRISNE